MYNYKWHQDKGFLFGNKYTAVFTTLNIDGDSSPEKITGLSTFPSINVSIIPSVQIVDIIDDSKIGVGYLFELTPFPSKKNTWSLH